jgi:hypothetical protein
MKAALLRFALMAGACVAACLLAGSALLLGPFIASIGVICTAAQRAPAGTAASIAYAVCIPLGLAAHALLPAGPLPAAGAALIGFGLLRAVGRPHAPALAMVAVMAQAGASLPELGSACAMVAALLAGGWLESRAPAQA